MIHTNWPEADHERTYIRYVYFDGQFKLQVYILRFNGTDCTRNSYIYFYSVLIICSFLRNNLNIFMLKYRFATD